LHHIQFAIAHAPRHLVTTVAALRYPASAGLAGESRVFPRARRTAYSPTTASMGEAKGASPVSVSGLGEMAWMGQPKRFLACARRHRSRRVSDAVAWSNRFPP